MTTVRTYRSTDASAPVLTGSVGTLVALLDACLVNGYGSQSAAGWTIPFTATNKRMYTNSAVDGTGFTLYVDDTGPGGGGAREARMTGFEVATAIGTGTGQFPTFAQLAIGIGALVCRKSTTADATARAWTLVADDTVFYFFAETGDFTSPTGPYAFAFGDFFSYATSDPYRCMIVGRNSENTNSLQQEWFPSLFQTGTANILSLTMAAHYIARSYTQIAGSIGFGKRTDQMLMGANGGGTAGSASSIGSAGLANNQNACAIGWIGQSSLPGPPYPNAADGALLMAPIWIHHNGVNRGYFKGLWAPMQNQPLAHNATFSGTGNLAGKSFLAQFLLTPGSAGPLAECFVETSSTWS